MKRILFLSLIVLSLLSCGNHKPASFNPDELIGVIEEIDYQNDLLVEQAGKNVPSVIDPATGIEYSPQEIMEAQALVSQDWKQFVSLCKSKKFDKATELLADNQFQGSVLGHLRSSGLRFDFIDQVLYTLINEYIPERESRISTHASWLEMEYMIDKTLVTDNSIPDNFRGVVTLLGYDYAMMDRVGDAISLADQVKQAAYLDFRDSLRSDLIYFSYVSNIFKISGDTLTSNEILDHFRDNILTHYEEPGSAMYNEIIEFIEVMKKE